MDKLTYSFSLVLEVPELTPADCDRLYETGCDDSTIVTRNGQSFVAFDRQADSLEAAIRSATSDVQSAGFRVVRVEMDVLV